MGDPALLTLTPAAHGAILTVEEAIEPALAGYGELAPLADSGVKYTAQSPHSGILHLDEQGPEVGSQAAITAQTAVTVHRLGEYLNARAIKALTETGAYHVASDAIYLLGRVVRLGGDEMSHLGTKRSATPCAPDNSPPPQKTIETLKAATSFFATQGSTGLCAVVCWYGEGLWLIR